MSFHSSSDMAASMISALDSVMVPLRRAAVA